MFLRIGVNQADRYIARYCSSYSKNVEYGRTIGEMFSSKTLKEIDDGLFNLTSPDKTEQMIIDRLFSVIKNSLNYVRFTNETGYFGVIRNTKCRGSNWSYLNLNENNFIESQVIYASSIDELEGKVKSRNAPWYVFDSALADTTRKRDSKISSHKGGLVGRIKSAKPKSRFEGMSPRDKVKMKRSIHSNLQVRRNSGLVKPYDLDRMFR